MRYIITSSFWAELGSNLSNKIEVYTETGSRAYNLYNRPALMRKYTLRRENGSLAGVVKKSTFPGDPAWKFECGGRTFGATVRADGVYEFTDGRTAVREGNRTVLLENGAAAAYAEEGKTTTVDAETEEELLILLSLTVAERWND